MTVPVEVLEFIDLLDEGTREAFAINASFMFAAIVLIAIGGLLIYTIRPKSGIAFIALGFIVGLSWTGLYIASLNVEAPEYEEPQPIAIDYGYEVANNMANDAIDAEINKWYDMTLDKPLSQGDLENLEAGHTVPAEIRDRDGFLYNGDYALRFTENNVLEVVSTKSTVPEPVRNIIPLGTTDDSAENPKESTEGSPEESTEGSPEESTSIENELEEDTESEEDADSEETTTTEDEEGTED